MTSIKRFTEISIESTTLVNIYNERVHVEVFRISEIADVYKVVASETLFEKGQYTKTGTLFEVQNIARTVVESWVECGFMVV